MVLSRIRPDIFFNVLKEYGSLSDEIVHQFPLEFYQETNFIYLYKTIGSKTYSTIMPITYDVESISATILHKGSEVSYEEFISDLLVNYKAIELIGNYDPKLVLRQE